MVKSFPILTFSGESQTITGSVSNLTCTVSYTISPESTVVEYWEMIVIGMPFIPTLLPVPLQYCGIVRCQDGILCSIKKEIALGAQTKFSKIFVEGNFHSKEYSVMGLASTNEGQLFPSNEFLFNFNTSSSSTVSFSTTLNFSEVVVDFGIASITKV